jgi:hypothetical protein
MRIIEGVLLLGLGILFLIGGLWITFGTIIYSLKEQDNEGFWYLLLSLPLIILSVTSLSGGWKRINNWKN